MIETSERTNERLNWSTAYVTDMLKQSLSKQASK